MHNHLSNMGTLYTFISFLFLLMPLHVKEQMCVTVLYVKNQQQTWNSHQSSVELRTSDQRKWTGSLRITINLWGALIRASVWIFWAIKIRDGETRAPGTLLTSNSKYIVFILFSIGCIHLSDPSDPHNVCKHLYETTGNKTWVIFLNLCLSVLCVPFLAMLKRFSK